MNNSSTYKVLGIMSGTSLDGIDLANCLLTLQNNQWSYKIVECTTIPYPALWKKKLIEAFDYDAKNLEQLSIQYGAYISDIILSETSGWDYEYIASHGHTILHQPENGITIQIGDGQTIANHCNKKVVYDFRTQDVHLGGQGAPLVPIGDRLLFNDYDYRINLGGFANISFERGSNTYAYDICPVNFVCNEIALILGKQYDESGNFARKGSLIKPLFDSLNSLSFYHQTPPKSLGREWVELHILPLISSYENPYDLLHTFTEHIAYQIGTNLNQHTTALFTGGGVFNTYLMERIQYYCPTVSFSKTDSKTIEFKEALIFAFLGVLKLRNETNTLASVTGAKEDHSAGKIAIPKNA